MQHGEARQFPGWSPPQGLFLVPVGHLQFVTGSLPMVCITAPFIRTWAHGSVSSVLGNFVLRDLSFLNCAVPVHGLAPRIIPVLHNARVRLAL